MTGTLAAFAVLCGGAALAAPDHPDGYNCGAGGTQRPALGRCDCPPHKTNTLQPDPRTGLNMAVCVAAPKTLRPPQLTAPADGATDVDITTDFSINPPDWADTVQVEICTDASCQGVPIRVFDKPVGSGPIVFRLDKLPPGEQLYWRVRGRSGGDLKGPAATRSFTAAGTRPPPPKLRKVTFEMCAANPSLCLFRRAGTAGATPQKSGEPAPGALASVASVASEVAAAGLTRSAAKHLELALHASQDHRCADVLAIYALPRDDDPAPTAQLAQLAKDCRIATANAQIIAAVDANDLAKAAQISIDFQGAHPGDEALAVFWGDAYRYAKSTPVDCGTARSFLYVGSTSIAQDPGNVAATVAAVCPEPPPGPDKPPPPATSAVSFYADTFYDVPLVGRLTTEGAGFALGFRIHVGDPTPDGTWNGSIGIGAVTVRPHADGIDDRIGSFWGGEVHGDYGMAEPSAFSIRFDGRAQFGGGHFVGPDNKHGVFVLDLVPGVSAKLRLGSWLRLSMRGGLHLGFAIDGGKQVDSGFSGFGERWHGTMGFDLGVGLDTIFQ